MIVLKSGQVLSEGELEVYSILGVTVYVHGLVYIDGHKSGKDSLEILVLDYLNTGKVNFSILRGAFSCIMISKDGTITAFADNSNMHCLFYTSSALATSCIQLAKHLLVHGEHLTLDRHAFCDLYVLGKILSTRTMVQQITSTASTEYLLINDGMLKVLDKGIGDITRRSSYQSIDQLLESFGKAVDGERIALSLTGGYDSRLLYSVLHSQLSLQPMISGDNHEEPDIVVAKKVARAGGQELQVVETPKPEIVATNLQDAFYRSDGLELYLSSWRQRFSQYTDYLTSQGYTLCISGDGGVLHKDWEWLQDLPFYNKKNTNIPRYYRQRLVADSSLYGLTSKMKAVYEQRKSELFARLNELRQSTNSQSYDMFYNYIHGVRVLNYNMYGARLSLYAPLQELEAVRVSYQLPRRLRFYNNNLRRMISRASATIAKLPTVYGTTASNEPFYMFRDVIFQLHDYGKKAVRLIHRKLFKKTLFVQQAVTWDITKELKQSAIAELALVSSVNHDLILADSKLEKMTVRQISSIMYAHYWLELIGNFR